MPFFLTFLMDTQPLQIHHTVTIQDSVALELSLVVYWKALLTSAQNWKFHGPLGGLSKCINLVSYGQKMPFNPLKSFILVVQALLQFCSPSKFASCCPPKSLQNVQNTWEYWPFALIEGQLHPTASGHTSSTLPFSMEPNYWAHT